MNTRKAGLNDLKNVANLFDQYRVWYRKESDIEGAIQFLGERMRKEDSIIFVVEDEEQNLIGFTQLYPLFSSTRMKRMWLLNDLFVHSNSRGLGVSKRLLNAAKNLCLETGACEVMLETENNNDIAIQLYESTGFELNTEHHFYAWTP